MRSERAQQELLARLRAADVGNRIQLHKRNDLAG